MRPPCCTTGSNWAPAAAPSWTSRSLRSKAPGWWRWGARIGPQRRAFLVRAGVCAPPTVASGAGALTPAWPATGIDLLVGIGGTPEGVLAASALKCMGGEIQGRLHPRRPEEAAWAVAQGAE